MMSNWRNRSTKFGYNQWRDPETSVVTFRGSGDIVTLNDEVQGTDHEICTDTTSTHTAPPQIPVSVPETGPDPNHPTQETLTVDEIVEAIGFGRFQFKLSMLTGLAWMADAMEMMLLSILAPQLHCEWRLTGLQVALITSAVFIGMMISSSMWGNVSDKYGRKFGLILCMAWTLYYGILSALAPVFGWILVLRGLVGFGIGGAPQSVTLYSEFLPTKTRGTCIMCIQIFWALGAVVEVLLAIWVMPTGGWRWLLGLSTIPLMVFVSLCFWLPESPRFDVLRGKSEKAVATMKRIALDNGKPMPEGTLVVNQQQERGRIRDLFTPQYRRTTLLLWFIWFANSFSYYGIVLMTTELFQAGHACGVTRGAKIEPSCNLECTYLTLEDYKDLLWTTLAEFPGLFVTLFVIDRIGRKKSMAMCFIVFSLCILPLYGCIGRAALTLFIFSGRAFITGGFQVAYVYTPEVFPTEIRAVGMGTCSGVGRVGALLTPFVAQVLLRKSVYASLSVYCGCCLLAAGASMCLPIETSGRFLQETSQSTGEQNTDRTSQETNGTVPAPHQQ